MTDLDNPGNKQPDSQISELISQLSNELGLAQENLLTRNEHTRGR